MVSFACISDPTGVAVSNMTNRNGRKMAWQVEIPIVARLLEVHYLSVVLVLFNPAQSLWFFL